ncbi:MAG: chromosome segregation protein SMC [Rhodobacterales bacterium]|nr:MAG: chromosome segregation protein SMC [Rhodobacterales bacterium]
MRFTRLRLNGFKSFVDPTDLVIHEGLTGVVGPNGCGKSNLLEALRWVMGETRAKAMRGGGMEDVIFAGTSSRPARNHAEVTLILDNSEHLAPAMFNEPESLDIVRRITRDAGSAYKVSGKDVRAKDVQMLFADASTGAQSPALVRQGQISELINAKPKARRRILEEAAGISGLYQRRHEAELKLKGAEQNLLRVDDVIEQLGGQLSSLARQAKQAARYREIGGQLRQAEGGLLLRRWQEAGEALAAAEAFLREKLTAAAGAEREAREAEAGRERAEGALPALREEEAIASALLQRLTIERDQLSEKEDQARGRIRGLTKRIEQIDRDSAREEGLNADAGSSIATLEAEQAELGAAGEGHEAKLAQAQDAAHEASEVLSAREGDLQVLTEDVARLSARHQSAKRLIDDSRKLQEKSQQAAETARAAQTAAKDAQGKAEGDHTAAAREAEEAAQTATRAEDALTQTEAARAQAQTAEGEARASLSEAEAAAKALRAEVAALTRLLERDRSGGAQLLDQIRVAPGFEAALGAALADDLKAPLVEADGSGWAALPDYDETQPLPAGTQALAAQVTGPATLRRRLDQIGVVDPAEGGALQAALRPGQRLVSRAGDLWRWDGLRLAAADAPSAAAQRLEQMNRLEALRGEAEEAETALTGAQDAHRAIAAQLEELTRADRTARDARREADRLVTEASRRLSRAEADKAMAESKAESAAIALRRHEDEAGEAGRSLAEAEAALRGLDDLDAARARVEDVKVTVEAARMTLMARRSALDEVSRDGEARTRRLGQVTQELTNWRKRLDSAGARLGDLARQRAQAETDLEDARGRPEAIAADRAALAGKIEEAETRRKASSDALAAGETALREAALEAREAERLASEAREARAGAEARRDGARETVEAAAERIDEALEQTPEGLRESLGDFATDMPSSDALETEVARLKRQRDALGAVNLRAEEDSREVQEEHDRLVSEKVDLEAAIGTLRSAISALNREGRERLLTAFEEVNESFGILFKHLFGGGEARLEMVESDDPLDAGLEILCQPPGKKLSTLSLLSGGEQTLTALALIFAVFLANPAPICVLDEVDAPLDDANVGRFCDLLDEMTRRTETRFLIITHHAVTMSRMDRLFGVTMQEQGVSQLVSVDLKKAEALVA